MGYVENRSQLRTTALDENNHRKKSNMNSITYVENKIITQVP